MGKVVVTVALGMELLFARDGLDEVALVDFEHVLVGVELANVAAVEFGAGGDSFLGGNCILADET